MARRGAWVGTGGGGSGGRAPEKGVRQLAGRCAGSVHPGEQRVEAFLGAIAQEESQKFAQR